MSVSIINLDAKIEEVLATVGYMPSALIGALSARNRDFVDHHKRSVLKMLNFVAGDRSRRMIASRMFGYGSKPNAAELGEVQGESFLASTTKVGQLSSSSIEAFEDGRDIGTKEGMAIPFGPGLPFKGVFANRPIWRGAAGENKLGDFDFVQVGGKTLIVDNRERTLKRRAKGGLAGGVIVGILLKRRHQAKRLRFMDAANKIAPAHQARMESDVDKAMTEAGRAALEESNKLLSSRREAWASAYRTFLTANPRAFTKARAVANAARRAVKADSLAGGRA